MLKLVFSIVFTGILTFISSYAQVNLDNNSVKEENKLLSVQEDPKNKLGLIHSVKKLEEASNLIKEGKINNAEKIILETKEWLTQAADLHFELFQPLSKNFKTISESKIEKAHALDFARARDQAYYLLARVYVLQNKHASAVKLLVEVIKSQPDSELAYDAYKTLQEIKFSDVPK